MSSAQLEKAQIFRALHRAGNCFVIPNPWDAGSAKVLAGLGFEALATTSAGCAFSLGLADGCGAASPEAMLANARAITDATDLPVSGDLENGWSPKPDEVAGVIRRAAQAGLVGASIEDSTSAPGEPIYPFELAVERIQSAVEAARSLEFPFTLTARSENFLHGRPDLDDTIRRLQAFQEAGADVLFAPGLGSLDQIEAVVSAVDRPVNVVMGLAGFAGSVEQLARIGVRRISLGSSLARAALGELTRAAKEVAEQGSFTFAERAAPFAELNSFFRQPSSS